MCQLLGMNCNVPTDICFSFEGFRRRGGETDHHADGWGIGFFEGAGCRLFLDWQSSCSSPIADLVRQYPIKSTNVISHIRKATVGQVSLANTHPFMRELWGRYWLFAHNGDLKSLPALRGNRFQPVGDTDSEHAFCWLMETLATAFPTQPDMPTLTQFLKLRMGELAERGTLNCLLSNGTVLIAHCATNLHYLVRQAPFGDAHLVDRDISIDFDALTGEHDRVAVIATQPLTDNEAWIRMQPGELLVFEDGQPRRI
ncbi:class II glutamine amidotransferase [Chitinimonas sp. BJYL2]|uniref:class II glutamine amidotransferase n=1 Tax=Chitinimonas sp. BJYL2 TaxID=2976696 RepID=UPI0022B49982|nr:class II glutamine amidotransferase [Chitinimonas sp. BJYL2]